MIARSSSSRCSSSPARLRARGSLMPAAARARDRARRCSPGRCPLRWQRACAACAGGEQRLRLRRLRQGRSAAAAKAGRRCADDRSRSPSIAALRRAERRESCLRARRRAGRSARSGPRASPCRRAPSAAGSGRVSGVPATLRTDTAPSARRRSTTASTSTSGADAPAVRPTRRLPSNHSGAQVVGGVDHVGVGAEPLGELAQAVAVRASSGCRRRSARRPPGASTLTASCRFCVA